MMNYSGDQQQTRRELFRRVIRWTAFGSLGLLSVKVLGRGGADATQCRRAVACHGCAALTYCALPQAAQARKAN